MNTKIQRLLQCTLCGYNQAGYPMHPPRCPQHTDRALVAQIYLMNGPKDFLLGARLGGKYLITHPLGSGQFGRVYYALQEGAGAILRPVAVKVLRDDRAEMQALFLDEMKVIAQLESRHIVRYLDSGFDEGNGLTYLVMELVDGETLLEHLNTSLSFSPERAARLIAQLLIALDEAHHEGVIHRDLKPSNLMISYVDGEEVLKVLDFGVSRPNASQPREQTQGVIPGTPEYMAPELFCGYTGEISAQMDLFSVGVVFYQMLMGHLPFMVEESTGSLIAYYKLYSGQPRATSISSSIPKGLADIVMKALQLDPKRRYMTAKDMLKVLAPWSSHAAQHLNMSKNRLHQELTVQSLPEGRQTKSKMMWLVAAAFIGGSLGVWAHVSRDEIQKIFNPQTQEIQVVENDETISPRAPSEHKARLP
jgi:serine/threonine protein kinase